MPCDFLRKAKSSSKDGSDKLFDARPGFNSAACCCLQKERTMELKTASSVINFIASLEAQSSDWYRNHARQQPDLDKLFSAFVAENKKFVKRLKRAYYSGVTDALETNFSFQGLDDAVEIPQTDESAAPKELLRQCLEMEKNIQSFYLHAAELSRDLLADLPRAMERVGRERDRRLGALKAKFQQL